MQYQVIYSDRKTLCMEIKNGQVIVRAPMRCSRKRISEFASKNEGWAIRKLDELAKRPATPMSLELSPKDLSLLKERAREVIIQRAHLLSEQSGLHARSFGITCARTRFGSCSAKNSISFSCFLSLYKQEYIDYVIMHELCHTVHKNHSADFYRLLEAHVPRCKELQRRLKRGDPECFVSVEL